MTDFEAIDALLDSARQEVPLPPAGERRALREGLNLSRSQVAQALGVGPSTVGGWEAGREPAGEVRERYAYFLDGARKRLDGTTAAPDAPEQRPRVRGTPRTGPRPHRRPGRRRRHAPRPPAVRALRTARRPPSRGFRPALEPGGLRYAAVRPAAAHGPADVQDPEQHRNGLPSGRRGVKVVPAGRRLKTADSPDLIGRAVAAALKAHAGTSPPRPPPW